MKTILIPTDLGADTHTLLAYAAQQARSTQTILYFMHATQGELATAEQTLRAAIDTALGQSDDRVEHRLLVRARARFFFVVLFGYGSEFLYG